MSDIFCNIFIDEDKKLNLINIININKISENVLSYVNDNFKYMADEISFNDNINKNKKYKAVLKITPKYELCSQYGDDYNETWDMNIIESLDF